MTCKIVTNHVPRKMIYGYELTDKEKKEFDYLSTEELQYHNFFRYKGNVYDFSEFMAVTGFSEFKGYWHGYASDSFFSGVLVRLCDGEPYYDDESVIVGWYCS